MSPFLVMLALVGMGGIIAFSLVQYNQWRSRMLRETLEKSFARVESGNNGELVARYKHLEVSIGEETRQKYYYHVVRCTTAFDLPTVRVHRESILDKLAKAIGFALEFQTHDEAFDRGVYINSDERTSDLTMFFSNPLFREQLRSMLDSNKVLSITFEHRHVTVYTEISTRGKDAENHLVDIVNELVKLVEQLPNEKVGQGVGETPAMKFVRQWGVLFAFPPAIGFAMSFGAMARIAAGHDSILQISLAAAACSMIVPWAVSKGKSDATSRFGWAFLAICPFVFVFAHYALLTYNEKAPQGGVLNLSPKITACNAYSSKSNPTYAITVELDSTTSYSRDISASEYQSCKDKGNLVVSVYPGALGYRWVSGFMFAQ